MRPEYFHTLKLSFSDSHAKHGLTAFSEYAALFAANELPVWYYYAVTACTLILIIKEPAVNPAQVPDARPVQMGNVELRIIGRAVCNLHEVPLREFYEPRKSPFNTIPNQSKFQCFSRGFSGVSFASMRVLSHEFNSRRVHARPCIHARTFVFRTPWFGAVTCVSHVLRCARARVVPFAV